MSNYVYNKKPCNQCHVLFVPTNGRQKYCPEHSPNLNRGKPRKHRPGRRTGLWIEGKIDDKTWQRINMLGELNDRHRDLFECGDRGGLLRLAQEYLQLKHPCTIMAKAIRMQAESLR